MKKTLLLVLVALVNLMSCKTGKEKQIYKRIIFDSTGMKVITHSFNKKLKTMSVLYGNAQAYNSALLTEGKRQPGSAYAFVTWEFQENPYWHGSQLSGKLLCVEKLSVSKSTEEGTVDYVVRFGKPKPVNGMVLSKSSRINYILDRRPSIQP